MKSLGWALPHPDRCLHKKRWLRHRHAQRDDHVKTQKEDSHLWGEAPEETNLANTWPSASGLQNAVRAAPSVVLRNGGPTRRRRAWASPPRTSVPHTLPSPGSACDAHNCWLKFAPTISWKNSYLSSEENRILKCWVQGNERQKQRLLMQGEHLSEAASVVQGAVPRRAPGRRRGVSLRHQSLHSQVFIPETLAACCLF